MSSKSIPILPGLPVIGNLLEFSRDRLGLYQRIETQYGEIGIYRLFTKPFAVTSNAELAYDLLVEQHAHFERSPVMLMMKPILGDGLLTTNNATNAQQRQDIMSVFQAERYPEYAKLIVEKTQQLCQDWQDGQRLNLSKTMQELTLGIISQALFSTDVLQEFPGFTQAIGNLLHYTDQRLKFLLPLPLSWPLPINQKLNASIKPLNVMLDQLISQRRRNLKNSPQDLLSLLLDTNDSATQKPLSNRQIRDQILTFLFAGHETTAHTLSWTFYLLAKNPAVYERLQDEVNTVLQGAPPTYENLKQLPYALQVIKEALRLYPVAYAFGRTALRPLQLGEYQVPQDLVVLVCPYVMHRNPAYFSEPELFAPERFTPKCEAKIPRFAYLPFGAGPRACIGRQFALMEAQLILALLAQRFHFKLLNKNQIVPLPMVTLRPSGEIIVQVNNSKTCSKYSEEPVIFNR